MNVETIESGTRRRYSYHIPKLVLVYISQDEGGGAVVELVEWLDSELSFGGTRV